MNPPIALGMAAAALMVGNASAYAGDHETTGFVERACLSDPGSEICFDAKLDTGADTSSLHALNIHEFKRDGKEWVRFSTGGNEANDRRLEVTVARWATIRRAGAQPQRRPVIRISICVAGMTADTEVTLSDRTGMDYKLLVGRSFLKSHFLVDSSAKYLATKHCSPGAAYQR